MNNYKLTTKKTWHQTQQELADCFELWGVKQWETTYPRGARLEGFSQSEQDRTVTLTYTKKGKTVNLTMGRQARAIDNLRVLFLAVDDMRMNEKRGISDLIESAYLQLNAPQEEMNPYDVLGLPRGTAKAVCEAQYKELAKQAHPDSGGSVERMKQLNDAIDKIRRNP